MAPIQQLAGPAIVGFAPFLMMVIVFMMNLLVRIKASEGG
jgi:hypothetical protein